MPGYRNPKFAYVEPRGGIPVVALVVLGVEAYSGYELAQWLASIVVVILICTGVAAVTSLAILVAVVQRHRGLQHLDAPQWVVERCGAPRLPSHAALPARPAPAITARPQSAIETPAVHYHLHLHAAPTAQPAIEEQQWSPSSASTRM